MPSRRNQAQLFRYLRGLTFVAGLFLITGSVAAQTLPAPGLPPERPSTSPSKPDSPDFGSPESEMHARMAVKADKKHYEENVARAKEAAALATQLVETYEAKKAFNSEDGKKLERLEKLTKRIRNEAGGSDTDPDIKDIPTAMDAVVKRVGELADDLRKLVESTPRHVISASVIDQANKLLGIIQRVRDGR